MNTTSPEHIKNFVGFFQGMLKEGFPQGVTRVAGPCTNEITRDCRPSDTYETVLSLSIYSS